MWPYNTQNNAQWIYVFGKNHTPKNLNISYAIFEKNKTDHEIHLETLDNCITKCTTRGVYISNIKAYRNDHCE
jgi:hypothetical protein